MVKDERLRHKHIYTDKLGEFHTEKAAEKGENADE